MTTSTGDTVAELVALSSVIAFGFLLAVAFYESLCKRDVLVARVMRRVRRTAGPTWLVGATYLATVGFGIPVLVLTWTVVLELALIVVGSVERIGNVALISTAIVAATRILAYVREKTSHELAKAIPLSLLFILLTGGTSRLEDNLQRIVEDPTRSELTSAMIGFLIVLEITMRLLTDSAHALLTAIRRRRGTDSNLGVWRTLWAAIRSPAAPD